MMKNIVLNNICKSFGEKQVLKDVSAVFPKEKTSCISAASGIGKTTLFRIMLGLEKPDSGDVTGLENEKISVVFQEDRLCEEFTVAENIKLTSPWVSDTEISDAMQRVALTDCYHQPVCELSGGMRRRAAVLRAVLHGGDVIMLDEPFKGLDEATKHKVMDFIKEKYAGKTILLITHDSGEANDMGCEFTLNI